MSRSRRFAWNVVTQWTAALVNAAVSIALVPFLLDELGKPAYGLTALVLTIVNFSLIAQLGLRAALGRQMSEQVALDEIDAVNRLLSTGVAAFLGVSLFVTVVLFLLAEPIVRLCQIPDSLTGDAVFLVRGFCSATVALSLLRPAWGSVLFGHSRFDLIDYAMIVDVLLRAAGVVVLLTWTDWGVIAWCWAMLFSKFVGFLITVVFAHRLHRGLKVTPGLVDLSMLLQLFSLGGLVSLRQIASRLSQTIEPFLISAYLGPAAVSLYDPASRLVNAPRPFLAAIGRQFTPMATGSHTTGNDQAVREILFRGTRLTFSIGALATVMLVAFAQPLILNWLGPGTTTTAWILTAGGMAQLMQYAIGSQWEVMLGKNNVRYFAVVQISVALANVTLAITAAWFAYHYAWATAAQRLLACSLAVVSPAILTRGVERIITCHHVAHECGSTSREYFTASYLRPLVTLLVTGGLATVIHLAFNLATWPRLILAATVVSLVWAGLCWWVVLDDVDRDRVRGLIRKLRKTSSSQGASTS